MWSTLFPFYIDGPNGREYFKADELKQANARAQSIADVTGKTVARYDLTGGSSLFYASETTTEGYKVYAGR